MGGVNLREGVAGGGGGRRGVAGGGVDAVQRAVTVLSLSSRNTHFIPTPGEDSVLAVTGEE